MLRCCENGSGVRMILTTITHTTAVQVLFIIGITLTVLPIFLYNTVFGRNEKIKKWTVRGVASGVLLCIPMIYYLYLDLRYDVSSFTLNDKLYLAAENMNIKAAEKLIADGADPGGDNRYGLTAVYRAVMLDDTDMTRLFLEWGINPNGASGQDMTMLSVAAGNQCNENVKLLLDAGADPDYRTDMYVPALHYAALNDEDYNDELVSMLIKAGADPSSQASVGGKVMLPYRYYFDEHENDEDITAEEEERFSRIHEMLYPEYIVWLMDKMENGGSAERKDEVEAVS